MPRVWKIVALGVIKVKSYLGARRELMKEKKGLKDTEETDHIAEKSLCKLWLRASHHLGNRMKLKTFPSWRTTLGLKQSVTVEISKENTALCFQRSLP